MANNFTYQPKTMKQLKDWYIGKVRKGISNFKDFEDFYQWYSEQEKKCHYCGLQEEESQKISMLGILKSKRFPQDGIIGKGTARGVWLEIDRQNPMGKYSRNNCVLSCYFCNNDKSDIFDGNAYGEFVRDRYGYLKKLL